MSRSAAPVLLLLLSLLAGCAGLEEIARAGTTPSGPPPLDEATIVAGLREALEVGTRKAVETVSARGGYWLSVNIRIPLPPQLEEAGSLLRRIGLGGQVDAFVESMNHAAEEAAPGATEIFLKAVQGMTFADARAILYGPDDAATRYFEEKTRGELRGAFSPVVGEALDRVGVTRLYRQVVEPYAPTGFDLQGYVTEKALDGLFYTLALEEKRIREDPLARVTELLRRVFGAAEG